MERSNSATVQGRPGTRKVSLDINMNQERWKIIHRFLGNDVDPVEVMSHALSVYAQMIRQSKKHGLVVVKHDDLKID